MGKDTFMASFILLRGLYFKKRYSQALNNIPQVKEVRATVEIGMKLLVTVYVIDFCNVGSSVNKVVQLVGQYMQNIINFYNAEFGNSSLFNTIIL